MLDTHNVIAWRQICTLIKLRERTQVTSLMVTIAALPQQILGLALILAHCESIDLFIGHTVAVAVMLSVAL